MQAHAHLRKPWFAIGVRSGPMVLRAGYGAAPAGTGLPSSGSAGGGPS